MIEIIENTVNDEEKTQDAAERRISEIINSVMMHTFIIEYGSDVICRVELETQSHFSCPMLYLYLVPGDVCKKPKMMHLRMQENCDGNWYFANYEDVQRVSNELGSDIIPNFLGTYASGMLDAFAQLKKYDEPNTDFFL